MLTAAQASAVGTCSVQDPARVQLLASSHCDCSEAGMMLEKASSKGLLAAPARDYNRVGLRSSAYIYVKSQIHSALGYETLCQLHLTPTAQGNLVACK